MSGKKSVGKKGIRYLKRILFHYRLQNFIANMFLLAAIIIMGFGIYTGARTAYLYCSCSEIVEGRVEVMNETENPILIQIEERFPDLKRKYPVIRYDTEKGKYMHQSSSSVNVSDDTQFSAQVRYNPAHEDQAILSIEIFDQIKKASTLLILGILIAVNSRFLHLPNWKNTEVMQDSLAQ